MEQLFLDDVMDMTNYILEENGTYARKVKKGIFFNNTIKLLLTAITV